MSRRGWWARAAVAVVVLPVVAAGAALALFDPNDLKPRIIAAVQDATGRTLALRGDLRISRSLWPTLEVNDATLSNLPGGSRPEMVRVERIEAQVSLPALLLQRRIEITRLALTGPNILFETVAGRPNWVFGQPAASPETAPAPPGDRFELQVRSARVQNGMVTWRLPARTKVVGIRALEFEHRARGEPVEMRSTLVYSDNQPFKLDVTAQPTGGVMAPWQTRLQFAAFDTAAQAQGTMALSGEYDLQLEARAEALEKLNALLPEMRLPPVRQAVVSTRIGNGRQPGDLPVVGATTLRFASADFGAFVAGLSLGEMRASLAAAGAQAAVEGVGRYGKTPFRMRGSFTVPTHPDGRVSVPVGLAVDSSAANATLALNGTLALDTLRFTGMDTKATLRTPALAGLRPVLGERLPALTGVQFDGGVSVPADAGPLRLSRVTLQTEQGDVAGGGAVAFAPGLALSGTWRSDTLDLDAMLRAFGIDTALPAGSGAASGPVIPNTALSWAALRGQTLDSPTLDVSLDVSSMRFQGETWRRVQLPLKLRGGRLQVQPMTFDGAAGRVSLGLAVDASAASAPVRLQLTAPALPLALVARVAGLPGPASGTARVGIDLQAAGRTVRELAGSLDGSVQVAVVDGQLSNAALLQLTSAALDALGIQVPAQGQTRIACLGVAGTFADGVGTLQTIALETDYLSLEGTGRVDLGRETLALRVFPLAEVAGSPVSVPVVVQGPFRNITGGLEASGLDKLGFFSTAYSAATRPGRARMPGSCLRNNGQCSVVRWVAWRTEALRTGVRIEGPVAMRTECSLPSRLASQKSRNLRRPGYCGARSIFCQI